MNDHDLLVELRTEMKGVRADIKEIKEGTAERLAILEGDHVTKREYEDHERRLRFLEKVAWVGMAALALLQLALKFLIK